MMKGEKEQKKKKVVDVKEAATYRTVVLVGTRGTRFSF